MLDFTDDILAQIMQWDMPIVVLNVSKELKCRAIGTGCNFTVMHIEPAQKDEYHKLDNTTIVRQYCRAGVMLRNYRTVAKWCRSRTDYIHGKIYAIATYVCWYTTTCADPNDDSIQCKIKVYFEWMEDDTDRKVIIVINDGPKYIVNIEDNRENIIFGEELTVGRSDTVYTYVKYAQSGFEAKYKLLFDLPTIEFCDGSRWSINDAIAELRNVASNIFRDDVR